MKRWFLLLVLADAVIMPIVMSGLCSTKEPVDPATFGIGAGGERPGSTALNSSTLSTSAQPIDPSCTLISFGGPAAANYIQDIKAAAAALPDGGIQVADPTADCPK
jgi:hypothetical protein